MPTARLTRSKAFLLLLIALLQLGLAGPMACPVPGEGSSMACCTAEQAPTPVPMDCCEEPEAPAPPVVPEPPCPCTVQPGPKPEPSQPLIGGSVPLGDEPFEAAFLVRAPLPGPAAWVPARTDVGPPIFRLHCALLI